MTIKDRNQQISDDVNYLKVTVDQVVKPALEDIRDFQKNMAVVGTKEFEKKTSELETRLLKLEVYNEENKPGVSLSNKLSATWIQILVALLAGGGVMVFVFQTLGALK